MPAKKEYLSSPGQRVLKISAAIFGSYFVAVSFHLFLGVVTPYRDIIMLTATFSLFLMWIGLMIVAFFARNGWKIWGIYLLLTLFFSAITYLFR